MPYLSVLYSRARNPVSALIRLSAWWGPWSHCALVDGDHVIEARAMSGGVVRTPLALALQRASAHEFVEVECPRPELGLEWARSTIGARYDWAGLFAIPARQRDWQRPGRWYCSEHVEVALIRSGRVRWRAGLHGVHPTQSYFVR